MLDNEDTTEESHEIVLLYCNIILLKEKNFTKAVWSHYCRGSSSSILKELQINWEISVILHDYHAFYSHLLWMGFITFWRCCANKVLSRFVNIRCKTWHFVDSQKVREHTWTSSPNVERLVTPLWNGKMSKKATKSTACHLSKATLLRGTVIKFIWLRYALCCEGNHFYFLCQRK